MEKQKNKPTLRFPEYSEEWEKKKLGDVADIKRGAASNHLKYVDDPNKGVRLLRINDFLNDDAVYIQDTHEIKRFRVKTNDLLIAGTGATAGITYIVPERYNDLAFSYNAPRIRLKNAQHYFIYYYLKSDIILKQQKKLFVGNAQPFLDTDSMRGFRISVPSPHEQTKIATFLTAVDERLTQLKQKKTLLEQYKKGVVQKIFAQEIRFNDDDGNEFPEWEIKSLGVLAKRITVKNKEGNTNVLTISAQQGLVSQLDFFNKSVSAKDVSGYYLLKKDDFAYNKSYSKGYPMGAIKRLKFYEKGVVSTLYICFTFNDCVNLSFMEQYFESGIHNQEIEKVAQEGARNHGLLNIGLSDFFSAEIVLPCLDEQTKIANFLSTIDEKINQSARQIEKTEQYKKGLLQLMFV